MGVDGCALGWVALVALSLLGPVAPVAVVWLGVAWLVVFGVRMGCEGRAINGLLWAASIVMLMVSAQWVVPNDWVSIDAAFWPPVPCVLVQCALAVFFGLHGQDARNFVFSSVAGVVSGAVLVARVPALGVALAPLGSVAVLVCVLIKAHHSKALNAGVDEIEVRVSSVPLGSLSPREGQVADLVAAGDSPAAVAKTLGIREGTVRVVLSHVYDKLHLEGIDSLRRAYGPADEESRASLDNACAGRQCLCFGVACGCCLAAPATVNAGFSLEVPLLAALIVLTVRCVLQGRACLAILFEDAWGVVLLVGALVGWISAASFARACAVAGLSAQLPLDFNAALLVRLVACAFPLAVAGLPTLVEQRSPFPVEEGQEERIGHYLRYRGCSALEAEVLLAIVAGKTGSQIAKSIHYSLGTVNRLRRCGYARVGVHSVAELRKLVADALAPGARPPLS